MINIAVTGCSQAFGACTYEEQRRQVFKYSLLVFLMGVAFLVTRFIQYTAFAISGSKLTERIRAKAFAHLLRQEVAFFDRLENSSGAICNRLSSDALAIQQITGARLGIVCESIAMFGIGVVLGVLMNWQLTLVALFYFVSLFILAIVQIRWQARLNKRSDDILELASSVRPTCRLQYHVH
ncbi:unnamed protein product [Rotaria sp. Silwood1]|nr:unnamed protein product [Rotaria sp. Silwood1]